MRRSLKIVYGAMLVLGAALLPAYGQSANRMGPFSFRFKTTAAADTSDVKIPFDLNKAATKADAGSPDEDRDGADPQQKPADDGQELSKQLSNPISSLISVPFQFNFDRNMGPNGDGNRMTLNIQPVIPFSLNDKWTLISRTILPVIHQSDVSAPNMSETGLGDIVQSFFFSPKKGKPFIWGAGPVFLVPTGTNNFLGSRQFGMGATVVLLKQTHGWTYGMLYNHIWGVAGGSGRPKVNSDFFQPFISYGTKSLWTFGLNTESSYDWNSNQWGVPIHASVSKLIKFGKQPVSLQGAARCWTASGPGGPHGCGPRFAIVFLFPVKH